MSEAHREMMLRTAVRASKHAAQVGTFHSTIPWQVLTWEKNTASKTAQPKNRHVSNEAGTERNVKTNFKTEQNVKMERNVVWNRYGDQQ